MAAHEEDGGAPKRDRRSMAAAKGVVVNGKDDDEKDTAVAGRRKASTTSARSVEKKTAADAAAAQTHCLRLVRRQEGMWIAAMRGAAWIYRGSRGGNNNNGFRSIGRKMCAGSFLVGMIKLFKVEMEWLANT